ncbi:MOSC domain-containing protein [Neptuniibacter halophilus]|uniref:MOSC domain-containing protein n=1 Tax=Neptuniibacter halophilus TaxID=651666 RepID=UPI00257455BE|nr:MOSC domain-containing protein [Neptuniibacter halophilus]
MSLQQMFARYARDLPAAELIWIGIRPERKQPMQALDQVYAWQGSGLEGDHRCSKTSGSARQVTLISAEFISQIGLYCGIPEPDPGTLRRNLVVRGINLNALRYQQFRIGEALFEATALCHPCSRMERALGPGGVAAMLGHGGLCCKILKSGEIKLGDQLEVLYKQPALF